MSDSDISDHKQYFSLSNWTSWQSKLQKIKRVSHSKETQDLVELNQFISVQGKITKYIQQIVHIACVV